MSVGVIIQAREGSSRLKGKVLMPLGNKTVLENVFERISHCEKIDKIIIATTQNSPNIIDLCKKNNYLYTVGSETDVLERYLQAAHEHKLDIIVRVTSDCPMIDPKVIDTLITMLIDNNYDYCTNSLPPTFARGLECSAFTYNVLVESAYSAVTEYEREHVVIYIRSNLDKYKCGNLKNDVNQTKYRITLDEFNDYILLQTIYSALYKEGEIIDVQEALRYIEKNELFKINEHVKQK